MIGSWLDLMLVLMLVTSIALGFHHGLIRQALMLAAMYIATVLSAQYYNHISDLLMNVFPSTTRAIADSIAFVLLAILFTVGLTWLTWRGFRGTRLPAALILDNFGGAVLGSIIGLFVISLTLMIARYAVEAPWAETSSVKFALQMGLSNSMLQNVFSTPLPIVQSLLHPLVPAGIPFISNG